MLTLGALVTFRSLLNTCTHRSVEESDGAVARVAEVEIVAGHQ